MAIDYKILLRKYMKLVVSEESVDYVYSHLEKESGCTPEEWKELVDTSESLEEEQHLAHQKWKAANPPKVEVRPPCWSCHGARVCMEGWCLDDSDHACHRCSGRGN